jgi:hypothetical protein
MSSFFIVSFFIESLDILSFDIESFDMLSLDIVSFDMLLTLPSGKTLNRSWRKLARRSSNHRRWKLWAN